MIELTDTQHRELEGTNKEVRVVDPATSKEYVLVAVDEFARLKKLIEQSLDASEQETWADAVEEARSEMSQE